MKYSTLIIGGPTASEKTKVAIQIARKIPSVIINSDSMQMYKDFRILSNRPDLQDFLGIKNELFGTLSLPNHPNFGDWYKLAQKKILKANQNNKLATVVGGTGLYLSGLEKKISYIPDVKKKVKNKIYEIYKTKGLFFVYNKLLKKDPKIALKLEPNDSQRIIRALSVKISTGKSLLYWQSEKFYPQKKNYLYLVIQNERKNLYDKINNRFNKMITRGVLDEVEKFLKKNIPISHPIYKMIGLNHLINYLNKKISLDEAVYESQKDTRRYAKRQITWFKNQPIKSKHLRYEEIESYIEKKQKYFYFNV